MDLKQKLNRINGYESPAKVNSILEALNTLGSNRVRVFLKEVCFKTASSRAVYCTRMRQLKIDGHIEEAFGTASEMMKAAKRSREILILCACRETTANKHTYAYTSGLVASLEEVSEKNAAQLLDWHDVVLYYVNRDLYCFDPRLDITSSEYSCRTLTFKLKERLIDFVNNNENLKVDNIYIAGCKVPGNCRKLSLKFILDVVNARRDGQKCDTYIFYQFVRGPRIPSRQLETLLAIPRKNL